MPDVEEENKAEEADEAASAAAAEAGEDGGSDDADQEAMMAEWAAMAEEGEEDAEDGAADAAAEDGPPLEKIPSIHEVSLEAYAILGKSSMPVSQLLRMGRGAVVELETGLGDEIEMRINDKLVAKGEVVVVEDRIAIEVTEIVKREGR
ncbi:FliM/FliN family flagellar motor switch protein [Pelagibius sp.]|uniref:FliM/FliN family flagellar motor switch protein n=1 Tax=Pelagibius sp. TaxID=1931238 RepID=UPI003BB1F6B0